MKFYEISQNNSGGSFDVDSKLCHRLIIEAETAEEAQTIAENLGCYWNGVDEGQDCECCGDRWHNPGDYNTIDLDNINKAYKKEELKFTSIENYVQFLADEYGWTTPDARIFYKNGEIKEIFSKKLEKK